MYEKAVNFESVMLTYAPDWFVTPKMLKVFDNVKTLDEFIVLHNKYKQYQAIKEIYIEFVSIALHPSIT